MPYVKCRKCNKEFYIKPSHQKLGFGKYCSVVCRPEGQKRGYEVNCNICEKKIWKSPKELKRSKSGLFFAVRLAKQNGVIATFQEKSIQIGSLANR